MIPAGPIRANMITSLSRRGSAVAQSCRKLAGATVTRVGVSVWSAGKVLGMSTPSEAAGEYLSTTALRDFGPPVPAGDQDDPVPTYVLNLTPQEAPLPVLLRHALALIGIPHHGPWEKVAWWVQFNFRGHPCSLAHQKFGLRLRISGDLTEDQADALLRQIQKKLISAVKTVEAMLAETAKETLNAGNVTVVNQHMQLRRAYDYFRQRAINPDHVEDVNESGETPDGGKWWSHVSGSDVMALNSSHDLVAAISAYVSVLEHDLVLALPFLDFDPRSDDLTEIIGDRWGDKWRRVFNRSDQESTRLRERLVEVVERWRNPYSHGGFEKGHGATVYLHTPGLGGLPVGMSSIRDSPLFSFHPVSETDIASVVALFDQIDDYLLNALPHAMAWIDSGLNVRFDAEFMAQVVSSLDALGDLDELISTSARRQDMINNMDY